MLNWFQFDTVSCDVAYIQMAILYDMDIRRHPERALLVYSTLFANHDALISVKCRPFHRSELDLPVTSHMCTKYRTRFEDGYCLHVRLCISVFC